MRNESGFKYFTVFLVLLLGTIFSLVAWVHGQDLANLHEKDERTAKETERVAAVQRDVVERLARVETSLINLTKTSDDSKRQLDKNGDKLDDVLQLLVKGHKAYKP